MTIYTLWLMIFTGLLFVCNILLWISTKKAADAAKKAANAMPVVERAYVFVKVEHARVIPSNGIITLTAYIMMENYGKTPAIINKIRGVISLNKAIIPEIEETEIPPGLVIGTGSDNFKREAISILLKADEWANVKMRGIPIYGCGRIEYEDIFHGTHITGFCWDFDPHDPPAEHQWVISSIYKDLNYYN